MNKQPGMLTNRQIASIDPEINYEQVIQMRERRLNPAAPRQEYQNKNDVDSYWSKESYQRQLPLKEKLGLPSDPGIIPELGRKVSLFKPTSLHVDFIMHLQAPHRPHAPPMHPRRSLCRIRYLRPLEL